MFKAPIQNKADKTQKQDKEFQNPFCRPYPVEKNTDLGDKLKKVLKETPKNEERA